MTAPAPPAAAPPPAVRGRLTARQREIVVAIVRLTAAAGAPPSFREVGDACGISSPNGVYVQLKAIAAKGWLDYDRCPHDGGKPQRARGIVVPEIHAAVRAAAGELLAALGEGD